MHERALRLVHSCLGLACLLATMHVLSRGQKPELVVQTGHSVSVANLVFSPDGKTLASRGSDGTTKLWDISTGTALRTINGAFGRSIAFSPDGKTLAAGDGSTINLWDVSTGVKVRAFAGNFDVTSIAFSPDGKKLASAGGDFTFKVGDVLTSTIKLWDLETGTELRTIAGTYNITSVAFSPDGKIFASGSTAFTAFTGKPGPSPVSTIRFWDVSTGTELHTFIGSSFAFSPDGKVLASEDVSGGGFGSKPDPPTASIKLWNVVTGTELRSFVTSPFSVTPLTFSPDGKMLATGSSPIKLLEIATGAELPALTGVGGQVVFSPDWKTVAGMEGMAIRLWDVATGTELRTLTWYFPPVYSGAISPNGKAFASGVGGGIDGFAGSIRLWDFSGNTELRTIIGTDLIDSVAFSSDGKTLVTATSAWYKEIAFWDFSTGTRLRRYQPFDSNTYFSFAFSPDGKTFAIGTSNQTIKLLDFLTLAELRVLTGHTATVTSVAFSPDGRNLVTQSEDGALKLWEVSTGRELRTLKGASGWNSIAFSPDGKTLASGTSDNLIKLWDWSNGLELRTITGFGGRSFAFSSDGKIVAGASTENTIKLWDVSTGNNLRTLSGNRPITRQIAFSPGDDYLFSGNEDSSMQIWDAKSGKELASLFAFGYDWIIATPDGLFDGTSGTWNQLLWRFNNNTFDHAPAEAFFSDYYHPGLLADILAGKRPKAPADISQKDRRQPKLELTLADPQPERLLTTRSVKVKISVAEMVADSEHKVNSGAQDVRLFRNGSLVKVWRGDVLGEASNTTLETAVAIVAGENRLTAYAFNHDNIKSSDVTLTVTGADTLKRAGIAYVLSVGVNQYANSQYDLRYAVADAQDFAEEIKRQQTRLNNYEGVEVLSLNNKDATKANILKSLAILSTKIQPEDALVIFFAGHGTAQRNRFYLVPHDLGYWGSRTKLNSNTLQGILLHSISDEEIEHAVEGIEAGQMLLVIDACNSGQALEAEEKRRGPMNSKGLAQLAYEKGM